MKKVLLFLFVAMAALVTTSCVKLDKRDQFVGDYSLKIHAQFAFENGQYQEFDLVDKELKIEKASGFGNLTVSGYYNCSAKVVGDVIVIDAIHSQSGALDMYIQESNGLFGDDGTLTFVGEATGTYDGIAFDAWFANEAMKK